MNYVYKYHAEMFLFCDDSLDCEFIIGSLKVIHWNESNLVESIISYQITLGKINGQIFSANFMRCILWFFLNSIKKS